jgi:ABC-2 type transport system ATP-binding protein
MLTLDSLTKKYGAILAVDHVSLQVNQGESCALLGPNGAGKTTLVRMILGFTRPTSGTVTFSGLPATDPAARARLGYLAEQIRIPPRLTGLQYLKRSAALLGLSGLMARREIVRVLELCGMQTEAGERAAGYSKGMRQRIGLAGAILGEPQLVVLDEPTSGLDPFGIRDMRSILDTLQQAGTTIVMNSHVLSEVEKICRTVIFMDHGRVVHQDDVNGIAKRCETLEDVFVRVMEKKNNV